MLGGTGEVTDLAGFESKGEGVAAANARELKIASGGNTVLRNEANFGSFEEGARKLCLRRTSVT